MNLAPRPPERLVPLLWGTLKIRKVTAMHTKRCLAQALISAIENARDREDFTAEEFDSWVRLGTEVDSNGKPVQYSSSPYSHAIEYLDSGLQDCRCWPERGAFFPMPEGFDTVQAHRWYAKRNAAVADMVARGFTEEAAWNHVEGQCDILYCGACNA